MAVDLSSLGQDPEGLVGGYQGNSTGIKITMGVLIAILLYNAVELTALIFLTFQRYRGLYFWSLMLSTTCGLYPSGIGNLLHFFDIGPLWLAIVLSNFGFYFMVPAQSLILYSRLHLVLYNQRLLRFILYAIIVNTVVIGVPVTTTTVGSAFVRTPGWNAAYTIMERLQVTWFGLQEFLISSLYIRETVKLLQCSSANTSRRKNIMYQLVAINVLAILMDVAVMTIEYIGLYYLQVLLKCTTYSIKLKLEFAVLGKLTAIVDSSHLELTPRGDADLSEIVAGRPVCDPMPSTWHVEMSSCKGHPEQNF
ncbi:hypothetical protein N7466_009435 [Penicillium verhagenii]|uniref:uncharacterized protein n=1 Tax=Penicillium verhagenii TaxID=1562060 RepID=UPI0025455DCA|nr:uncharacterized protein N7466_009435 [Penicillium verhagenii]KAJ5921109.1 hypothetical protein N7466_009435 [Penicillium verhagenii]